MALILARLGVFAQEVMRFISASFCLTDIKMFNRTILEEYIHMGSLSQTESQLNLRFDITGSHAYIDHEL